MVTVATFWYQIIHPAKEQLGWNLILPSPILWKLCAFFLITSLGFCFFTSKWGCSRSPVTKWNPAGSSQDRPLPHILCYSSSLRYLDNSISCIFPEFFRYQSEVKVAQSCPSFCNPMDLRSPWNSPGQNTGVGSLSLLQGIFPTQGSHSVSHIAGRFFTSWATREAQKDWLEPSKDRKN